MGAAPVIALFRKVCRPIATRKTPGAFLCGYRLMGVDGTVEDVPDSLENSKAFGRQRGSRGDSAFPQLRNVHLVELGTHVVCDSIVRGYQFGERSAALRLLRSVVGNMLLMWDRGFHSYDQIEATLERGAQYLGRVPSHAIFEPIDIFPDGSFTSRIFPTPVDRAKGRNGIKVRIIEYSIDDKLREGHGLVHRLITSLMDHEVAPAKLLAVEYHQRWETEITFDEIDTHQRVHKQPLRSQKPIGIIQEVYGMLIAHYLVRFFMHEAAMEIQVDPDRLSFTSSLRIVRRKFDKFQIVGEKEFEPLYRRMIREIARQVLPPRDNRSNPRVVKKKMSKFPLKRPEHRPIQHSHKSIDDAIVMLN